MSSFKIGVLSDPHYKVELQKEAIEYLKEQGAEYLLHLGDLCIEENLKSLKDSKLPYAAVFGNNDASLIGLESFYNIKKEPYYLKIKDLTIKMMHLPYYMSADSQLVLFGHLHQFSVEKKGGSLFLNPGEICARNKNLTECVLLEVKKDNFLVEYFFKEPNALKWQSKIYEFKRG